MFLKPKSGTLFQSASKTGRAARVEKILASARVAVAAFSLAAVYFAPTKLSHPPAWAYVVLITYACLSFAFFGYVRWRPVERRIIPIVHAVDFLFLVLVCALARDPSNSFFAFFTFATVMAAYRWGVWEAVVTGGGFLIALLMESLWIGDGTESLARGDLFGFVMGSAYLSVVAILLAYLAGEDKRIQEEDSFISHLLRVSRAETEFAPRVRILLNAIREFFGARRILLLIQENSTHRVFLWEYPASDTEPRSVELSPAKAQQLLFRGPASIWHWRNSRSGENCRIVTHRGSDVFTSRIQFALPKTFLEEAACDSFLATTFVFGENVAGRLYILDPLAGYSPSRKMLCLMRLSEELGPFVHNIYLLRRVRSRIRALEQARAAREIHDGIIQSLTGLDMEIEVLLLRNGQDGANRHQLARIQHLLREQSQQARDLMNRMRMPALTPSEFLAFLRDLVTKFGYEAGVQARFVCQTGPPLLPAQTCHEVARIVQEGLVNARKHARAKHVQVTLSSEVKAIKLMIEDDGASSGPSGWPDEAENGKRSWEPTVIKERVRLLKGTLSVESRTGGGACLVITIPTSEYPLSWAHDNWDAHESGNTPSVTPENYSKHNRSSSFSEA